MVNNIANVDARLLQQNINISKPTMASVSLPMPAILGFKTPLIKQKAKLIVKKIKRSDNIVIIGDIDDDYVDIHEEKISDNTNSYRNFNFFKQQEDIRKTKILKSCYVIDQIISPVQRKGLGTEAIKNLVEKAMFDSHAQGRIVTFSAPVHREASPALFFYKLGFRFIDPLANEYMIECLKKKEPDLPAQTGMMYLPRTNLHKLLRYGDVF